MLLLPLLPLGFDFWLLLYIVATMAYSLYLKRVSLVDEEKCCCCRCSWSSCTRPKR